MDVLPSKGFFLDIKKGALLRRQDGKLNRWAVPEAWLWDSCSGRRSLQGRGRLQESGRWPLFQHIWHSLVTIWLGNIIKGLRLNQLFVLDVFFWSACLSQVRLLVTGWLSLLELSTLPRNKYCVQVFPFSVLSVNTETGQAAIQLTTNFLHLL